MRTYREQLFKPVFSLSDVDSAIIGVGHSIDSDAPRQSHDKGPATICPKIGNIRKCPRLLLCQTQRRHEMKYALVFAAVAVLATPALAEEVGVGVGAGPVGAGVTVGQTPDRDRERTTVIKEREPAERTTVIKKERDDEPRTKTIIKERD